MVNIQIELPPGCFVPRLFVPVLPALLWLASAASAAFLSTAGTRSTASAALASGFFLLGVNGTRFPASACLSVLLTTSNSEART